MEIEGVHTVRWPMDFGVSKHCALFRPFPVDTIQACIAPSSIIIPYMWALCQGIEPMIGMNYVHQTVNPTENVVDPATEAHTKPSNLSDTSTRCRISANAAYTYL